MPIYSSTVAETGLNVVRIAGAVTADDLTCLIDFYRAAGGRAAKTDGLYIFAPGSDMSTITEEILISFKRELIEVLAGVQRPFFVRTALVCQEPRCLHLLEAWSTMSARDDGLYSDVRIEREIADACVWLGLTGAEADLVVESAAVDRDAHEAALATTKSFRE